MCFQKLFRTGGLYSYLKRRGKSGADKNTNDFLIKVVREEVCIYGKANEF